MAYFRTMVSLTMALIVHLLQIGFIFGIINTLFPIGPTTDPGQLRFVKMGFIFLLIYFLITLIFPKKAILKVKVSQYQISKGGKYFTWYFVGSFVLLVLMLVYKL